MSSTELVEVGDLFNIGIGFGDSAVCKVIRIEEPYMADESVIAVLEMVEYGGPLQRQHISTLQNIKNNNSQDYIGKE